MFQNENITFTNAVWREEEGWARARARAEQVDRSMEIKAHLLNLNRRYGDEMLSKR